MCVFFLNTVASNSYKVKNISKEFHSLVALKAMKVIHCMPLSRVESSAQLLVVFIIMAKSETIIKYALLQLKKCGVYFKMDMCLFVSAYVHANTFTSKWLGEYVLKFTNSSQNV